MITKINLSCAELGPAQPQLVLCLDIALFLLLGSFGFVWVLYFVSTQLKFWPFCCWAVKIIVLEQLRYQNAYKLCSLILNAVNLGSRCRSI